jgi:hypothetical protein
VPKREDFDISELRSGAAIRLPQRQCSGRLWAGFVIVPEAAGTFFLVGRFLMGPEQAGVEHVFLGELELPLPPTELPDGIAC